MEEMEMSLHPRSGIYLRKTFNLGKSSVHDDESSSKA